MPRLMCVAILALCLAGCGGVKLQSISGTVTLKGENLDEGTISFVDAQGNPVSTGITNGAFALPKEKGLAPGKYKVSIDSPDGKTPDGDPNAPPGPSGNFTSKNRIPAAFNTRSMLEVEVKAGEKNEYRFDVP